MPPRRQSKLALRALVGFQGDIDALPNLATRKMALNMLVLVRDGQVRGDPLDARIGTGDCYRSYFDPDGSGKPRFRLVYRYTPDEITAVAVEAVAVGRRANPDAYQRAVANLGRALRRARPGDRRRLAVAVDICPPTTGIDLITTDPSQRRPCCAGSIWHTKIF